MPEVLGRNLWEWFLTFTFYGVGIPLIWVGAYLFIKDQLTRHRPPADDQAEDQV
jgi:hypothetical protein